MKNLKSSIITALFAVLSSLAQSQTPWVLDGNTGTDPSTDFLGTTDDKDLVFRTDDVEEMRLLVGGWLGLNTTSPSGLLHINDGCILGTGTTGTNPNLGAGTRLMWIPTMSAFRAGTVSTTQWDTPNVGQHSAAFGFNNISSGEGSFAAGKWNISSGLGSVAIGLNNQALNTSSIALGEDNQALAQGCVALGDLCIADGHDSFAAGEESISDGTVTIALGYANEAHNKFNVAIGALNVVNGFWLLPNAEKMSFALGGANLVQSSQTGLIGHKLSTTLQADKSYGLGAYSRLEASKTISIGIGYGENSPLVNNVSGSIMLGSGSDVSTIFIEGAPELGSSGKVGIGNITSPSQRLDVNGTARLRAMPNQTPNVLIVGTEESAPGDYTLNYLLFSGENDQYLGGNGIWQDFPINPLCEWNEGINVEDLVMGYATACHEGNVGIGLNNPQAKLEVFKDGSGLNQHVVGAHIDLIGTNNGGTNESRGLEIDVTGDNVDVDYAHTGIKADVLYSRRIRGIEVNTTAGVQTGENYGVQSIAAGQSTSTSCNNIGVWGEAKNAPSLARDIGIYGIANDGANANIAVFGKVSSGQTSYAGYFQGNVYTVGNIHATGVITQSDAMLKTDIQPLENNLEVIMQLAPKQYLFLSDEFPQLELPDGLQAGLIAQELEEVLPGLVSECTVFGQTNDAGESINENVSYKGVDYVKLIPYLIGAIQEQQSQIEILEQSLNECCSSDYKSEESEVDQTLKVTLHNQPSAVLCQNTPNPHQGNCIIRYFLPEELGHAEMQFFDTQGSLMKIIPLNQTGMSQIDVDASGLASGVYTYALVVNGTVIDLKKMIRE